MRARYYEPWTGRFLSEDPAMDGANWYVYCGNDPVCRGDYTGKAWWFCVGMAIAGALVGMATYAAYQFGADQPVTAGGLAASALAGALTTLMAAAVSWVGAAGALSAAAMGDAILVTLATGTFTAGASALFGKMHSAIDEGQRPSGLGKIYSAVLGLQFLIAMELCLIDAQ
jgi:hypothetical protein